MLALQRRFQSNLIEIARARRAPLAEQGTNILRIFNGASDGLAGVYIDDFAGHWLASTRDVDFPHALFSGIPAGWKALYHKELARDHRAAPRHVGGEILDGPFLARENGLSFEIDFHAGYSQGFFHDQRVNRKFLIDFLKRRRERVGGARMEILNTFAYTCAFSVAAAALAGVRATSIDLSAQALEWGRRNFRLNALDADEHDFLKGDVADWLGRLGRQRRQFDAIIIDPPTFSRNHRGKVFRVDRDFGALAARATTLLAPGGLLLCSTNRESLSLRAFRELVLSELPRTPAKVQSLPMPPDFADDHPLKTLALEFP